MKIVDLSQWLPHRDRDNSPTLLVLHATAGATARSSIDWLRKVGSSYHYIIARDGKDSKDYPTSEQSEPIIFRCAPENSHAFHTSTLIPSPCGGGGVNKYSIGISLANIQRRARPEQYTQGQISALSALIADILGRHPTIKWITTHAACQPWNRSDPAMLELDAMYNRYGLKFWGPAPEEVDRYRPRKTALAG